MKKTQFYLFLMSCLSVLLFACNEKNKVEPSIPQETLAVNQWVYENMQLYYLWNDYLPNIDYTQEEDPIAYFEKLLYTAEDRWSWISDDYASFSAEYSGTQQTMGYSPAFYKLTEEQVIIVVQFVFPGSAADLAGLKRGDLILTIDNTIMTTTNYYQLYSGSSYTVQLGQVSNGTASATGTSISLTAQTTVTDPSIYHEVMDINGKKIAYLVYTDFISGDGNIFRTSLGNIFTSFLNDGATELIVDLRYNRGGEGDAAEYLASSIGPSSIVASQNVLVNLQYNAGLQNELESDQQYADRLSMNFTTSATNMDLQTVYFLTTGSSASASEVVIVGLEPYMNVVTIGETTAGKYTGMWVLPDDNEEWVMLPVVFKYSNSVGYTDFGDGLAPDYLVEDNLVGAPPFGDLSDPVLAKAVELITGSVVKKSAKPQPKLSAKQITPREGMLRSNLLVPGVIK